MSTGIKNTLGGFEIVESEYPSGDKYLVVMRGLEIIGDCIAVEGGFLVSNKRKPVATILLAVKQMIDGKMNKAQAEMARWQKMMMLLKKECGPITKA